MHSAASNGRLEVVKLLLERHSAVNAKPVSGKGGEKFMALVLVYVREKESKCRRLDLLKEPHTENGGDTDMHMKMKKKERLGSKGMKVDTTFMLVLIVTVDCASPSALMSVCAVLGAVHLDSYI